MKLLAAMLKEQFLGKLPGNFPSLIPPIDRRTGFIVHSKLALTFCGRWPPRRGRLQALTLSEWCVRSEKRASVVFIANPWAYALVSRAQGHGGELIKAFFPARPPTHPLTLPPAALSACSVKYAAQHAREEETIFCSAHPPPDCLVNELIKLECKHN